MANIKDVAALANVSIATVSNYLNHTKPVSKAASHEVKKAIEELRYVQNSSAKSLKTSVYTDIGIILPNFNDSYYVQIFQGVEYILQNSGYYLNLAFSYDIPELEQNIVHNMLRKQAAGLILISCQPNNWKFYYENFTKNNHPIVLIDRAIKRLDTSFISFDNQAAVCHMTLKLLQMQYQKICIITGPEVYTCEADCIKGYLEAYRLEGKQPHPGSIICTDLNKEDAFRKITGLLKTDMPEIILATSELTATGIIEALRVLGYSTHDIPVVTLGEEHWNKYTHSFATFSTARPAMKLGERAANLMIEKLKSPQIQESEQIVLRDNLADDTARFAACLGHQAIVRPPATEKKSIRVLMLDTPLVHTFRGLLKNFENQTGITAEVVIRPHHNLYETIVSSHDNPSQDNQFDVYMYDIPWLPLLASQKILEDISENLETINTGIFLPGCLEYFSAFQQKFYGVPFMYAPQILYYRKDLFDDTTLRSNFERLYGASLRPPITLKEFNAIAEFFTCKTDVIPYGISIPAAYDECLAPELYMRLRAYGSNIIDADGSVVFDNPQTLKAYINFVRAIKFAKPDYMNATDASIVDDFLQGETAMLISYPAFLSNVSDLRKSSMIGSIGYSQIPGRSPLLGGWSLGINNRSCQKEAAFTFIKWTCNEQMGNYFALLGGQSAITSTYANDELVKLYPWLPLYQAAYRYTKPMLPPVIRSGNVISPNAIDAIICKWAYRMINSSCEMDEIMTGTQTDLQNLINPLRRR